MFCVLNQFLLTHILVFAPSACTRIISPLGSFTTCHLVWGSFPATWSQFCCCPFHATFRSEPVAVVYILPPAANLSLPCFFTGDHNFFLDENPWFPDSSLCLCSLYGCLLQTDTRPHLLKSKSLLIVRQSIFLVTFATYSLTGLFS